MSACLQPLLEHPQAAFFGVLACSLCLSLLTRAAFRHYCTVSSAPTSPWVPVCSIRWSACLQPPSLVQLPAASTWPCWPKPPSGLTTQSLVLLSALTACLQPPLEHIPIDFLPTHEHLPATPQSLQPPWDKTHCTYETFLPKQIRKLACLQWSYCFSWHAIFSV